jgi:Domain of unknown function (DUF1918)
MRAEKGDKLCTHGRTVGQQDRFAEVVEVMGNDGAPPYRVRYDDGHETVLSPGPDSVIEHQAGSPEPGRG